MMLQKDIERKARKIARKKLKEFLESEKLMTLQKEEKPEKKVDMKDIFGHPMSKQKNNEQEMTFEKEDNSEKLKQLKKLLYDTKSTSTKPVEKADEGTGVSADMSFAKEDRSEHKKQLDELLNTNTDKINVDDVNYNTLSAEDFANILGENKIYKFLEEDSDEDEDIEDKESDENDENPDEDEEPKENEKDEDTEDEEPEEEPEENEETEEEPEEKVSGMVISDDMLDELVDRILDKFNDLGLVIVSADDEDLDKLADEIQDKIKNKVNVLSDDEFEEAVSYQVDKSLKNYKKINESLLKRRWKKFIQEMENGKLEPSKIGKIKESKDNSNINKKLENLSVNTKISKSTSIDTNKLIEDKTIKLLLEDEK